MFPQTAESLRTPDACAPRIVLSLIAEGLSNKATAARLFVTDRTIDAHVKQIFLELGIDANPQSHRRVLAVLANLRAGAGTH